MVDLQGWDVVNAASFDVVNAAIQRSSTSPQTFTLAPWGLERVDLNGSWDTWKLVSGSAGATLAISLPVKSGTAIYDQPPYVYATFDPTTSGTVTFDQARLTVSPSPSATSQESAFGSIAQSSGKWYFEVTNPSSVMSATGKIAYVGIGTTRAPNQTFTNDASGYGYEVNGTLRSNKIEVQVKGPTGMVDPAPWNKAGDTIGVAVDLDRGMIWFRGPDGSWQGAGADPVAGTGAAFSSITASASAPLYAAVSVGKGIASLTINFGASPFQHALPVGFRGWMAPPTRKSVKLDGATVSGTIRLAKVPGSGNQMKLVVDDQSLPTNPATTVTAVTLAGGLAADPPVVQAFGEWLNDNIASFTKIFHTIDITAPATTPTGNQQAAAAPTWMKPTGFAYAAADLPKLNPSDPTLSALAILTETEQRTNPNLARQVSANILQDMPKDANGNPANAVVAISTERLLVKILLPGLVTMFKAANSTISEQDFQFDSKGMVVTNKTVLKFGDMKLRDGTTVNPEIPAGGVRASIDATRIKLTISDISFDYPGAVFGLGESVTFSFDQYLYLTLNKRKDGKNVLYATFKDPADPNDNGKPRADDVRISYQLSASAQQATMGLMITGIILSVLSIGLIGSAVKGWSLAGTAADTDATNAAALVAKNGNAVNPYGVLPGAAHVYEQIGDKLGGTITREMSEINAGQFIPPTTVAPAPLGGSCMLFMAQHALGLTVLGAFSGLLTAADWAAFGLSQTSADAIAVGDFNGLPASSTLEDQMAKNLLPFEWTDTKTWTLVDARLNGSLLIYGTLA